MKGNLLFDILGVLLLVALIEASCTDDGLQWCYTTDEGERECNSIKLSSKEKDDGN